MAARAARQNVKSDLVPLAPGTKCRAKYSFEPHQRDQLKFVKGDLLTLTRPDYRLFWYEATNERGDVGIVPVNYLDVPKAAVRMSGANGGYMDASDRTTTPVPARSSEDPFRPGSFVETIDAAIGNAKDALAFKKGDSLRIIRRSSDPNWYVAENERGDEGRVHRSKIKLTYSYAYVSIEADAKQALHSYGGGGGGGGEGDESSFDWGLPVYTSFREFKRHSGWFREVGSSEAKEAFLPRCIAERCRMSLDDYLLTSSAVFVFAHRNGRKFVGAATNLSKYFTVFFSEDNLYRKPVRKMDGLEREILLASPNKMDWKISVHPCLSSKLQAMQCQFIVREKSLRGAKDGPVGMARFVQPRGGFNEKLQFTNSEQFQEFATAHSERLRGGVPVPKPKPKKPSHPHRY